jgi:hypothetical protein
MAGFAALGADRSGSAGFVVGGAAIPASRSVLGADHDLGEYAVVTGARRSRFRGSVLWELLCARWLGQ